MTPRASSSPGPSRRPRPGVRPRLAAAATAAVLAVGVAACGADDTDGGNGASDTAVEAGSLEAAMTVDPGPAPDVRLLEPGAGERRVVTYGPSRAPAVVEITRSGSSRTAVPGTAPRVDDTPEQVLTVEGGSDPDVDGAQRATVTVLDFTSVDEHRSAQFATAPGFTVTWTRGADGVVRQVSLEAPVGATDVARAGVEITAGAVSDTTVVWPREAIGVGARWEVTRRVDDAVAPRRVTTYELTGLEGDVATVEHTTTAPDPSPTLTAPGPDGEGGVALDVDTYEVAGRGELTVDLRSALPVDGRTESSTRAVYVDPDSGARTTHDENSVLEFARAD